MIALALLIATVVSGFAHHVSRPDAELAAFVAAGGTAEDICNEDGVPHSGATDCDACRLIGAAVLPGTNGPMVSVCAVISDGVAYATMVLHLAKDLDHARALRAPPVV